MRKPITLFAALGFCLTVAQAENTLATTPAPAQPHQFTQSTKINVPLRFDAYYTYEQVGEALRALNAAFPELTKLEEIGRAHV